jgi:hypothetical protein
MQWGDDELSKFLNAAYNNQRASHEKLRAAYDILKEIDSLFLSAGRHLRAPKPVLAGTLYLRAFYAYRASAGLALAGQVVEAFAVMRTALESAGYCLLVAVNPSLEEVLISRHAGVNEMKVQKSSFLMKNVIAAIAGADDKLAKIFDDLYQRTIDFGGHPNPHALFAPMAMDQRDGEVMLTSFAFAVERQTCDTPPKAPRRLGSHASTSCSTSSKPSSNCLVSASDWKCFGLPQTSNSSREAATTHQRGPSTPSAAAGDHSYKPKAHPVGTHLATKV